MSDNGKIFF